MYETDLEPLMKLTGLMVDLYQGLKVKSLSLKSQDTNNREGKL